jgi:hypothetical protein
MDSHGYRIAVPVHDGEAEARPLLDLSSGYVQRAVSILPKQGNKAPWTIRQNYMLDYFTANHSDVTEAMRFSTGVGPRWSADAAAAEAVPA